MAPPSERHGFNPISSFIQSTTSTFSSLLAPKPLRYPSETTPFPPLVSTATTSGSTPRVLLSLPLADSPVTVLTRDDSSAIKPPESVAGGGASLGYDAGFSPSTFKIGRMSSAGNGAGGPAFVGQVFSMCDLTGTGLMAVSTHFEIPFLSKRTPEWMKKMLQRVVKSDNGPVFRFFMDLGDAVAYVKQLNIPSGIVGACRLDLAYEHFKEKPHLFQFIPNEKQVKLANKLLKKIPQVDGRRKIDGVPVFSAQNLDIAIATTDGIKWYTPYFFDKSTLDNIIEESIDQHFHALIQSRHVHRRRDVMDDNAPAEVVEETADSMVEPAEVQELLDEVGYPAIPFSVISKAAELQLMYAVDRLLLGNKCLRKATGIQPKVPYMVDSFEKRSAASLLRVSGASKSVTDIERGRHTGYLDDHNSSKPEAKGEPPYSLQNDFRFSFGDWFKQPWSSPQMEQQDGGDQRNLGPLEQCEKKEMQLSPLLPNVTMVGVSASEPGQMSKATLKKTMEKLTNELEQDGQGSAASNGKNSKPNHEDRDPLFVANVGSYYSGLVKTSPTRWANGGNN